MPTPPAVAAPARRRRPIVPVLLLLWLLAVACASLVPQNGWDATAGPVVPHDSFPGDCSLCHTGGNWHTIKADFTFDHAAKTGVPLDGAHATASCLMCHNDRGPVAQFSARGCGGCHADPHLERLGANCQDCHDERSWRAKEAIVAHDRTRFPLTGSHAAAACFRCHAGAQVGNFAGAPVQCEQCHEADYQRTQNPNHTQVSFPRDCDSCHLPFAWSSARFDHPASFPLTQGHAGRRCGECHTTPNSFTGLSTTCSSCHTDDYTAAVVGHVPAGFGTDCTQCHTTRAWRPADWQHPSGFALTFGHAGRQCLECHQNQVYSGTSGTCSSCHLDTYQATTNPNHALAGYGTDCAGCHNTVRWQGAGVAHPASFPLTNAHQRTCTDCHQGGVYTGLSPACATCHLADYQQANDPPNVSFGLSQQCEQCHSTTVWGDGNWNHQFPITTGNHSGLACFDCHNNAANRVAFSCIDCHEHNQNSTNQDHQGVSGYTWTTAGCYQCHLDGRD